MGLGLPAAAATLLAIAAFPAPAADLANRVYEIRPQAVSTALRAFAAQSDMQLIFADSEVGRTETGGVTGNLSPREALATILKDTGLEFEFTENNVVVVRKASASKAASTRTAQPVSSASELPAAPARGRFIRLAQRETAGEQGSDVSGGESPASEGPAPQAVQEERVEQIVVTGSRIVRQDFVAASPIVTVGSELLEQTSNVALEANLNKLPQFVPAVSQFVTQDVQNTATNTVGASTVSLRGLGANRNLVLLDGRRGTPINASMVVDINSIPSAAIERVEVITGGASSTYGADAVGGVVNFILKKNFEGFQLDGQYGATGESDGEEYRISALVGGNFSDDRGNVMLGIEHFDRSEVLKGDRDFQNALWANPSVAGDDFFPSPVYWSPGFVNTPSRAAVDAIFTQVPGQVPTNTSFFLNDDGTIFGGGGGFTSGGSGSAGLYRYNGPLGTFRKVQANGQLGQNSINDLFSTPMTRWSIFGRANYEFNDSVSFFSQGYFNRVRTTSVLQPSPAANSWGAMIPYGTGIYAPSVGPGGTTLPAYQAGGLYGLNCPAMGGCTNSQAFPVPAELAALLDSRLLPNEPWQLNQALDFMGNRGSRNNNYTFQLLAGFNGRLLDDWTWEAFTSMGETSAQADLVGFGSLSRYRAVVTSPNYGKSFSSTGNMPTPGFGFAGATGTCTSGLPVFSNVALTQDCFDAINADLKNNMRMKQEIAEANIQGGLFELPAGELRFALGTSYRRNQFSYETDILSSQGVSFLDGVIGVFPAGNSSGSIDVTEGYGELLVPIVKDLPLVKSFNLELGYRYSDYNSVGGVSTYKVLGDWETTGWLRFRGGIQEASRAPNIGELFLARTQSVAFSFLGDACSRGNAVAPFSAHPNNPNAAAVENICRTLMGPVGAAQFYSNAQAPGGLTLALPNTVGNPNLEVETANTSTFGFVLRSPSDHPLLSRLSLAVDWYRIKLEDAIGAQTPDAAAAACFDPAFNPTFDPNTTACRAIQRDPNTGAPGSLSVTYSNAGQIDTSGIDLQLDWGSALADMGLPGPGAFSINFLLNYLDKFESSTTVGAPMVDYADTLGPAAGSNGLNAGAFQFRSFTTMTYSHGSAGVSLAWRHLPSVKSVNAASNPATTSLGAPSYNLFDLRGTWALTDSIVLRGGVDNLFDKEPPIVERNPAAADGMAGGAINANFYDVLGRRFYLGAAVEF